MIVPYLDPLQPCTCLLLIAQIVPLSSRAKFLRNPAKTSSVLPPQVLDTPSVRPNMQQARSYHALLATQALARLAGLLPPPNRTPKHDSAAACLRGALTESLAMRLGAEEPQELLKDLNSSLESAQVRGRGVRCCCCCSQCMGSAHGGRCMVFAMHGRLGAALVGVGCSSACML